MNILMTYYQNFTEIKLLCSAIIFLLFYYLIFFFVLIRHQAKMPTIIPLYQPPKGLSAALCRYILNMRYDNKVFEAALVELEAKGYLKINCNTNILFGAVLERSMPNKETDKLSELEQQLLDNIFKDSSKTVNLLNIPREVEVTFMKHLTSLNKKKIFNDYWAVPIIAYVISFFVLIIAYNLAYPESHSKPVNFNFYIFELFILVVVQKLFIILKPKYKPLSLLMLLSGFTGISFVALLLIFKVNNFHDLIINFASFALILTNFIAVFFSGRPSVAGQKLRSEIKGFQIFLDKTEKNHLKSKRPEETSALFNQYFPYAYALDVSAGWTSYLMSRMSPNTAEENSSVSNVD